MLANAPLLCTHRLVTASNLGSHRALLVALAVTPAAADKAPAPRRELHLAPNHLATEHNPCALAKPCRVTTPSHLLGSRSSVATFFTSSASRLAEKPSPHSADVAMAEAPQGYHKGDLSPRAKQLIQDAQDLFCAKPSHAIFQRSWHPDATFNDPICHARGAREYEAQWWGMPAAFARSQTRAWYVVRDEERRVEYVQRQYYKVKGLGVEKEMLSTVVMDLDESGRIVNFEDRWNHKPMPTNPIAYGLRRLNALVMPYLIKVPPPS